MNRNTGVLIGLLAVAGGLIYVGNELNRNRRTREITKSKDKKRIKKGDFENRVFAGFRQAAQLKG